MTVRIGFIGVGGVAQTHLRVLEALADVAIVGVCDVRIEAAQGIARRYDGCRAYADHRQMLEEVDLDAVYVCLPPGSHAGQEIDVVRRGKALFVEKPVGLDRGWVRETASAVVGSGVVTSVGYNWRYLDVTESARRELEGRAVGLAVGYWIGGLPGTPWWRLRAQSGGQLVEQTTHILDLCRYLIGEVRQVFGGASRGQFADVANYDIDDASAATLRFANGAVATVVSSDLAPRGYQQVGLHLFSRELVIEISSSRLRVSRPGRVEELLSAGSGYAAEDRAFVHAVATGDRSGIRCDYQDATRTLEVSLAIADSIASGQAVEVGA